MKISFLIPAVVLYVVRKSFCYDIQVGTVLFTKADLVRKCWTESDKALLRARLVMQDVLPDPRCIDFSKPSAVSTILDYIYACFHIISTSTYGKLQNLMYLALADAVGGYLRGYVLPLTRKSYYAGLVTYDDACRVFTFYDQIRDYLKTNGVGWVEPQKVVFKNIKVSPLEIVGGDPEACKILYTIEKKGKLHCINAKCCPKSSKLPDLKIMEMPRQTTTEKEFKLFTDNFQTLTSTLFPKEMTNVTSNFTPKTSKAPAVVKNGKSHFKAPAAKEDILTDAKDVFTNENSFKGPGNPHAGNETLEEFVEKTNEDRYTRCDCCERKKSDNKVKTPRRIIIPLPILDDECDPHTIAVPFRKRPLRNLWRKTSAFILEHYYVAVLQCFISKGNTRSDIQNFNSQFYSWVISQVYPRLEDEKWYPAFGGILRVTETIKRFGAETKLNEPMSHDIAFMFRKGVGFDYPVNAEKSNSKDKTRDIGDIEYYYPSKSRRYYAFAILVAAAVWLIVFCGCAFFCMGVKSNRSDSRKSCRPQTTFNLSTNIPTREAETCLPEKKAVSFQFLVRQKLTFRQNEGGQQVMTSRGDIADYLVSDLRKNEKPPWACISTFPIQEFELPKNVGNAAGEGNIRHCGVSEFEPSKVVQTLWKNPFFWPQSTTNGKGFNTKKKSWFKLVSKERKGRGTSASESISKSTNESKSSANKGSSSFSYREGCPNSNSCTSTTNCTSRTHLEEQRSSTTTRFFESLIPGRGSTKKRFQQKSSTESESDNNSCTSDNEY